jgi:hypothetical protein
MPSLVGNTNSLHGSPPLDPVAITLRGPVRSGAGLGGGAATLAVAAGDGRPVADAWTEGRPTTERGAESSVHAATEPEVRHTIMATDRTEFFILPGPSPGVPRPAGC